jgi:isoleucyl-tRNA synthetase
VIDDLKDRGLLFKRETVRHDYPFCWRADEDPLIQYARPAWFIRTTAQIADAIDNNGHVAWLPEHIRDGRFGDFLRNNVDWALSRERFWGTPLNIWTCEACGERAAPASVAEIEALNPGAFDPSVDEHLRVHRPWIDNVTLPCAACGGTMHRVPEVIDCWFDSGCMPFAQWGFPHQGVDRFRAAFPADFISEAIDQTRGWFYSLLMISTLLFDDETCQRHGLDPVGFPRPYKRCIVLGHVTDADGRKESKSKGNYTSPNLVLRGHTTLDALPDPSLARGTVGLKPDQVKSLDLAAEERVSIASGRPGPEAGRFAVVGARVGPKDTVHLHPDDLAAMGLPATGGRVGFAVPFEPPGADAFRWLFCASSPVTTNTRLSMRAIRDGQREFLLRLRNVYAFFQIYANIAAENGQLDLAAGPPRPPAARAALDRWILHRLHATTATVTSRMDEYLMYESAQALSAFVEDLSNWYVRRSRSRFWGEGEDTVDALWTLYEVLHALSRLIAPFVPFTAEGLYRALGPQAGAAGPDSVHLCAWPEVDPTLLDPELDAGMSLVRELASLGLAARSASRIKVRQPLQAITVVLADPAREADVRALEALLTDELNVREVRFAADAHEFVDYRVKPDFKKLGPRLGKGVKEVAGLLAAMDGAAVKAAVEGEGLVLSLPEGPVTLTAEDVTVAVLKKEHFEAASSPVAVVALSTDLDDDLRAEGLVRELISKVQSLRKELDLGYTERIGLTVACPAPVRAALERFGHALSGETLATSLAVVEAAEGARAFEVEGYEVGVVVHRG